MEEKGGIYSAERMKSDSIPEVSILVPLFNESPSLSRLSAWVKKVCLSANLRYELIFVDDGSVDDSWEVISGLSGNDSCIRGIRFRSNYGKSAALQEGFRVCRAPVVLTMDADLQDSPDEIVPLYRMLIEGDYDLVSGWKYARKDNIIRRIYSWIFNCVVSFVSGISLHDFNCGLKAYKREAVQGLYLYGDLHRYIPVLLHWHGFRRITEKRVAHYSRVYGRSRYGWNRVTHGLLDLLSVFFVVRFGRRPMHFFGFVGLWSFFIGGGLVLYLIVTKLYRLFHGLPVREVVDQPLFYLSLVGIVIGFQCFLGAFIADMMVLSIRNKPLNIIDKEL